MKRVIKHCDDYIDDETQPQVLRTYLDRARQPAHGMTSKEPYPKLFADYKKTRVRVTMASRFGHVGISKELEQEFGYWLCVSVADLSNFADKP